VSKPLLGSSAQVAVQPENESINVLTNLKLVIQTIMPLPSKSNIKVVIPTNWDISSITKVTGGATLRANIEYEFDEDARTIYAKNVNANFI
jgi:hypothetical protein